MSNDLMRYSILSPLLGVALLTGGQQVWPLVQLAGCVLLVILAAPGVRRRA